MEYENRWNRLNEHLLARPAKARRIELHRLRVGDAYERVFYSVHRIVLLESFDQSPERMFGWNETRENGPRCRFGVTANLQW